MLRLGGIGGDHHPEGHKTKNAAKVFVNNDIQAEMLSFLVNEIVAKQSDGDITLHVNRSGFLNTPVSSKYHIKSLDPTFAAIKGELAFRAGDVDRTIVIPVSRDPSQEEHVIFTVVLARFIVDITVLGFIHVESWYAKKDEAGADHQKSHRQHAAKKEWKYSTTLLRI